jgi:uncharacterized membrane protein YkvA (DUF1232 family)
MAAATPATPSAPAGRRKALIMDWVERLRQWARALRLDIVTLWVVARQPATPLRIRLVAGAVAAYALSPIDLIPDFIPVLGYLDDLILVPFGLWIAIRMIPESLLAAARIKAHAILKRPVSMAGAVFVGLLWICSIALAAWFWV